MTYPTTGRADYLALGDYNAVCYFCGFKYKASALRRHWQGFYVCGTCFEIRHPQDFVRAIPDVQTPPWAQPRPAPLFSSASPTHITVTTPPQYTDTGVYLPFIPEETTAASDPSVPGGPVYIDAPNVPPYQVTVPLTADEPVILKLQTGAGGIPVWGSFGQTLLGSAITTAATYATETFIYTGYGAAGRYDNPDTPQLGSIVNATVGSFTILSLLTTTFSGITVTGVEMFGAIAQPAFTSMVIFREDASDNPNDPSLRIYTSASAVYATVPPNVDSTTWAWLGNIYVAGGVYTTYFYL